MVGCSRIAGVHSASGVDFGLSLSAAEQKAAENFGIECQLVAVDKPLGLGEYFCTEETAVADLLDSPVGAEHDEHRVGFGGYGRNLLRFGEGFGTTGYCIGQKRGRKLALRSIQG